MEVFDDDFLQNMAIALGNSWPQLAVYLGFDDVESRDIKCRNHTECTQAAHMLQTWRSRYTGYNKIKVLTRALKIIRRYDLLRKIGEECLF